MGQSRPSAPDHGTSGPPPTTDMSQHRANRREGPECEELNLSKSSPPLVAQRTSTSGAATSLMGQHRKLLVISMASSREFIEERLRFLQIAGVKAFGEPAIDWREQSAGLRVLALVAPESGKTDRGSQLE